MTADVTIVSAWVRAWAVSRGVAPPVAAHGGYCVQVGLPDQARRYVFSALNEGAVALAEALDERFVFLKICAAPDAVRAVLPARWVIQAPSFMMMVDGAMVGGAGVPARYRLVVEGGAPVASVRIVAATGRRRRGGRWCWRTGLRFMTGLRRCCGIVGMGWGGR